MTLIPVKYIECIPACLLKLLLDASYVCICLSPLAQEKALLLCEALLHAGTGAEVDMADAALRLSLDMLGLSKLGYDFEVWSRRQCIYCGQHALQCKVA